MKILRRLNNTYQKVHRNRHLVAKNLNLSNIEYRLWDLCLAIYDWDQKHEGFSTFKFTDRELANIFSSASTINRVKASLINKGILSLIDRSTYKINLLPGSIFYESCLNKNVSPTEQDVPLIGQDVPSVKQKLGYSDEIPIFSYKDNIIKQGIRSDGEYKEILNSGDYERLIIDDFKWIDEYPFKVSVVKDGDRLERDIVEAFFDGDQGKYRKHLIS